MHAACIVKMDKVRLTAIVVNTIVNFSLRLCREICYRAENFLIYIFTLPGREESFTISRRNLPRISDADLPLARQAKYLYEQTYNGQLTDERQFGPLSDDDALLQQRKEFRYCQNFWRSYKWPILKIQTKPYFIISQQQTGSPKIGVANKRLI